ncbi:uncharacterized protein LOC124175649 [Neodiprion fabricii]|uniref:uncharacterized protein LOC124175649 n=1 Tax=Neodiprion fabricii TaxID=2872261 RepID=UPI001ED93C1C|nr:uncharacterized protein LOC124175649 [Neodiprion fabricii]
MDACGTCVGSKEEQLYMVELLVDKLNLSPDKVREAGTAPLSVHLKFVDFPAFEISQAEFVTAKKQSDKDASLNSDRKTGAEGLVDFSAGKSCLFTKQPRDLVQAMQSQPLKIGVYKTREKVPCEPPKGDKPICETQVPLSGCLCDQVAMAMNDAGHLPKPYTLKNTYNLIDYQGKPSGTIAIFLRLSCFGKSIVTHFAFQERSFLFKSPQSSDEFQCTRVPPDPEVLARKANQVKDKICVPPGGTEQEEDPLPRPRDVVGLALICQELARRDGGPANLDPPISAPSTAPRVGMNRPSFEKLTSAEKLNDRDYRGLVYRAYPNQPTCACAPGGNFLKGITGDVPCTGAACGGGCCVGTRRFDPPANDHHGGGKNMPCYTGNCCSGTPWVPGGGSRLRGGGCCDGNYSRNGQQRGGSVAQIMTKTTTNRCSTGNTGIPAQPIEALMTGACSVPQAGENAKKSSGCGCQGKSGGGEMPMRAAIGKDGGSCTKRPCLGIDCLLRAFKETQEFVDSIGKVPGLAGLGLPDPSESPYFGRDRDTSCSPKKPPGSRASPYTSAASVNSPAKNQPVGVKTTPGFPSPYTVAMAGRTGVVREAVSSFPETGSFGSTRAKKKDEKSDKQSELLPLPPLEIELGPCGEPRCRSRRKKPREEAHGPEAQGGATLSKKFPAQVRPASGGGSSKTNGGTGGGARPVSRGKQPKGPHAVPGPAGDRAHSGSKSYVKVSRRVMKFVYTAGASYPGINYGHKNCLDARMRVPANMGWLWNTNEVVGRLKPRLGWKPGAISRYMNELLRQAKMAGNANSRPGSSSSRSKKGKMLKNKSRSSPSIHKSQGTGKKKDEEEEVELPPTLHIHRKDGTYYVTMYPIKQETMEVPQLQEPMKPLQFKITKNKDDASIASSSTASDMEIEFSPPAAVNRYRKKPNVIHVDTQVKQQEILDAFKPPGSKKGKGDGKGTGKKGKKK